MRISLSFPSLGLIASLLFTAVLVWVLIIGRPVSASPQEQGGAAPITITEKGCDFDIDDDGDGESDGGFDPSDGAYLPQGDSVLGECFFKVTSTAAARVTVESQLENWVVDGFYQKVAREIREPVSLNGGDPSFTLDSGGHQIRFDLTGDIPRGHDRAEMGEGYYHDLQVPKHFKLVDITVTTDAGDKEWVQSHEVSSASVSYIDAHYEISQTASHADSQVPPSVVAFSQQLLAEGYPEIAVRVIDLQFVTDDDPTSQRVELPGWVWGVIAVGVIAVVAGGGVFWWARRPPPSVDD